MKPHTKKPRALERVCSLLDISPESMPHGHAIEILGRSLVKISGAKRILMYTDTEIRISLPRKNEFISVRGASLSCSSYNRGILGINGMIDSVSFCATDKGERG